MGTRAIRSFGAMGIVGLWAGLALLGCNRQEPADEAAAPAPIAENTAKTEAPQTPEYARLHQPFTEATSQPSPDQRLPETTMTGRSVGKTYLQVVRLWDTIKLISPEGKKLSYTATLETELGSIELALQSESAPNHVRSFIALALAGYYDRLVFERAIHEEAEGRPDAKVDLIEAGCPMGTGDLGYGSIGYWLKPEFNAELRHEAGSIGACHGEDPDTAACKFYITLCKAPALDGEFTIFAKVTKGMDVAHKIFTQPVRNDAEFPEGDRPEKPIVIRTVTIRCDGVEYGGGGAKPRKGPRARPPQ